MSKSQVHIKTNIEIFERWRQFETDYGFSPCIFARMVQNDMEMSFEQMKELISVNHAAFDAKHKGMAENYKTLMDATLNYINDKRL